MTATVIDITSRLKPQPETCVCGRHAFEAVIVRATDRLDAAAGALLIDRADLEAVIADVRVTLELVLTAGREARP